MACQHGIPQDQKKGRKNQETKRVQEQSKPTTLPKDLQGALLGTWCYQFSKHQGDTFCSTDLKGLSTYFSFELGDAKSIQRKFPKFYNFAKNASLFPCLSTHEDYHYGTQSFPLVNTIPEDSTWASITHYVCGNGVGKMYSYYITHIENESLVLKKNINYPKEGVLVSGVRHHYLKIPHPTPPHQHRQQQQI